MATIEHSVLSGSEIHEPKGVDSASSGTCYVADGSGSGEWVELWNRWSWNIDNASSAATALVSGSATVLTNDGLGAASLDFSLPGTSNPWDSSDNSFDFSAAGLEVGDDFELRIDLTYTVNSANDGFELYLNYDDTGDDELSIHVASENVDLVGSKNYIINFTGFVGNSTFLLNPARLYIVADSTNDEVLLNGFKFTALPRKHRTEP